MATESFVLADFLENKEKGFYIWNPDFHHVDEFEEELQRENEIISEYMGYNPFFEKEEISFDEINERNKKRLLVDTFCQENIEYTKIKDNDNALLIKYLNPGYGFRWVELHEEDIEGLPIDAIINILKKNFKTFCFFPELFEILDITIFESSKGKKFLKFFLSSPFFPSPSASPFAVVYDIENEEYLISRIVEKFGLQNSISVAWKEFEKKEKERREREERKKQIRKVIKKAMRIVRKDDVLSDLRRYIIVERSDSVYIFNPRRSSHSTYYYSIFKVEKRIGESDTLTPLFYISLDEFIKEWEPLLEP